MKTICVGGSASNCGKTAVVELLAKAFPGWAAVKVTPSSLEAACPHGRDCGACSPPEGPYEIISDRGVLAVPGKDTVRYLDAGVSRVLWIRSLPEHIPAALNEALAELSHVPGVIVESTTVIGAVDALNILVLREGAVSLKESARKCLDRVDIVALNLSLDSQSKHAATAKVRGPVGKSAQIIPMCAVLPPDDRTNREFVDACRDYLRRQDRCYAQR